jgi:hypothetical protein
MIDNRISEIADLIVCGMVQIALSEVAAQNAMELLLSTVSIIMMTIKI